MVLWSPLVDKETQGAQSRSQAIASMGLVYSPTFTITAFSAVLEDFLLRSRCAWGTCVKGIRLGLAIAEHWGESREFRVSATLLLSGVSPPPCSCSQLVFARVTSHKPPHLGLCSLWPEMGWVCKTEDLGGESQQWNSFVRNPCLRASPAWKPNEPTALSACGQQVDACSLLSDPSARSLMASRMSSADGSPGVNLRATCTKRKILAVVGSETRMSAYPAMFQQKARFHASKLICEHETLSLRGPRDMFQALEVAPELPRIDLAALQQIIHLAASTLDLEVVRQNEDGKMKRRALDPLVQHCCAEALQRWRNLSKRFSIEALQRSDLILVHVRIAVRWSWKEPLPGESCLGLSRPRQDWQKTCSSPPNAYATRKDLLLAPCVQTFCDGGYTIHGCKNQPFM